MIKEVTDRDVVTAYVGAARQELESGAHDDTALRAARRLGLEVDSAHDAALLFAEQLPADGPGPETDPAQEEPFISRNPLVSLLQTSLEAQLHGEGQAAEAPPEHPHHGLFGHVWDKVKQFVADAQLTARGAGMAGEVVEGALSRLADGTHAFNPEPAEHTVDVPARLIIVGDWGSGLKQARAVAQLMAEEVDEAVQSSRAVHVIHLGDVYFAGEADEYRRHVLADGFWPVRAAQADAGIGSWSLAGNHDLYGGAHAYFTVLLGDPRFRLQRSPDGKATSWFRLTIGGWEIVGLDTAWNDDPFEAGQTGLLEDPQAARLAEWVAESKDGDPRRLLLTHHQLMTVYDSRLKNVLDAGKRPPLHTKLGDLVRNGAIDAWIWGHEHRCMAFRHPTLKYPRCLGHGGQLLEALPPDALLPDPAIWQEIAAFDEAGHRWGALGFAVLDVEEDSIEVRYRLVGAHAQVAAETL
jgi:calcineurin-like phosphoesterase family protein